MITKEQIRNLAKYFQIDEFTIFREYLQLVFLGYLYREKEADQVYFKGGTAIRLLFDSPRFSEDLDFSTTLSKQEIKKMLKKIELSIQNELPDLKILPLYSGKQGIRFRVKYSSGEFKYPFVIRLDFTEINKSKMTQTTPLVTRFPIANFPLVICLSDEEILAEKINALMERDKGRDVFDVWFLLKKEIPLNWKLIKQKYDKEKVNKKIKSFSVKKLNLDLAKFLPKSHRKIVGRLRSQILE